MSFWTIPGGFFTPIPHLLSRTTLAIGTLFISHWLISDILHWPGGSLGFTIAGLGAWWLLRPTALAKFRKPASVQGWVTRCCEALEHYSALEQETGLDSADDSRRQAFAAVTNRSGPVTVALVGAHPELLPDTKAMSYALASHAPVTLCRAKSLPHFNGNQPWPDILRQQDILVYSLPVPLLAADLLWLARISQEQPAWLLLRCPIDSWNLELQETVAAQLPQRWRDYLLPWSGDVGTLRPALQPLRQQLEQPLQILALTQQRLLHDLHLNWQRDMEGLRRSRFRELQQRSQWIIAGAVLASPLPSTDLLAVVVGNGLMLREMAAIWRCSWRPELLQVTVSYLASAALMQGLAEWTGQMLLGSLKLDVGSWVAAGALQALSAAYFTRVVGRSMADWMALNSGIAVPDLEELRRQAPLLVARAAEEERLDWRNFLEQTKHWLRAQQVSW